MDTYRKSAAFAGVLFLVATAAYMSGNALIESILGASDYLERAADYQSRIVLGVVLEFINSVSVVGIAIVLFPILKLCNEKIALGYVGFRVIEAVLLLVGSVGPLLLVALSREYAAADVSSDLHVLGTLIKEGSTYAFQLGMLALGVYSLFFCYLLYRFRLVPRVLSVLGFIGYAALSASAITELMGHDGMLLYIPGAVFELALPLWLMVKGVKLPEGAR